MRDKLDPRASPGVFLGYPSKKNRYKVMILDTKKVVISRNVTFRENVFPLRIFQSRIFQGMETLQIISDHQDLWFS